jgi:DNA-binding LacI/PurR family transcriptional regulator
MPEAIRRRCVRRRRDASSTARRLFCWTLLILLPVRKSRTPSFAQALLSSTTTGSSRIARVAYYVSFNNVSVGKLIGKGLLAALKAQKEYRRHPTIAILNGAITDNNARLVKDGYDSVLCPLFAKGKFRRAKAGDQWTNWDPIKALNIFEQMLARNHYRIDGVIAANDALAGSVVAALKHHGLKAVESSASTPPTSGRSTKRLRLVVAFPPALVSSSTTRQTTSRSHGL